MFLQRLGQACDEAECKKFSQMLKRCFFKAEVAFAIVCFILSWDSWVRWHPLISWKHLFTLFGDERGSDIEDGQSDNRTWFQCLRNTFHSQFCLLFLQNGFNRNKFVPGSHFCMSFMFANQYFYSFFVINKMPVCYCARAGKWLYEKAVWYISIVAHRSQNSTCKKLQSCI